MAFALVQSTPKAATTGTNPTITLTSAPTQGNLIVVFLGSNDATLAHFTDPTGYSRAAVINASVTGIIVEKVAGAGESATITWTNPSSFSYEIEAMEFSGNAASGSEFDAGAAGSSSAGANSLQPGSLQPIENSELLVAASYAVSTDGGSEAITSGFTVLDAATLTKIVVGYKVKGAEHSAENPTLSWLTSRICVSQMASFRASNPSPDFRYLISQRGGFF